MYDPDLIGSDLDLDLLDFDTRDAVEARRMDRFSASLTGHAERPGTRRRIGDAHAEDPLLRLALSAEDEALAADFDVPLPLLLESS